MELSEPVRAVLERLKSVRGDIVISAENAQKLFLGTSETTVGDLSDLELLQLTVIVQDDAIRDLEHEVKGLELRPNRAARRHPRA